MEYTTLIATFYSIEPFMPAALAYSPNRIVLLVDSSSKEVRENIEKVRGTFGKVAKVEVVKVNSSDLYAIAGKAVSIIDMEDKNTRIIVNISGGWRVIATGVLLGCYARRARVHEIVTNSVPENGLLKLPKLGYDLSEAKREVLEKIAQNEEKSVAQIAKELKKTRGMIYQHLRELIDTGYVDEKFNVTEAGRLALL
ncbi:MAG: CRISPR-associated CARF protein Csa3 [Candidatus Marsarchaeota archaeon]|nr:CRISPR-associated CARF protein Csa3 [Candidatus Marsarchaeota archaeon]MCL5418960.1 CRISPR-associated CARF protein Csa3 [Candidatus Marsarchaeota archaeon]